MDNFRADLDSIVAESAAEIGVYYRDVESDAVLSINADVRMHAASTMKVPVMMRLFCDATDGRLLLDDQLPIRTTFSSIVDGSPYTMAPTDDSDRALFAAVGEQRSVRELIDLMITRSSNLATNILIEVAGAERVTAMCREMGAGSMDVLRGVEDIKAFRAGMSNTTTARSLGTLMAALARGQAGTQSASQAMVDILLRQEFNDRIPAGLPPGTKVAHKTGWISGIDHDAAIVYPASGRPYVLVLMVRGMADEAVSAPVMARMSKVVYDHHLNLAC